MIRQLRTRQLASLALRRPQIAAAAAAAAATAVSRPTQLRFFASAEPSAEAKAAEAVADAEAKENPQSEIAKLQEQLLAKDKEVAQFKDKWTRSVAEFRNLQRTTAEDVKKAKDFALQKFARDLLESVDNFDLALGTVKKESLQANAELNSFFEGIQMVQRVLEGTLSRHGLVKTEPIGEKFDPSEHEAVFQAPHDTHEPGTIFHVQQRGFKLHDRVIRAPKVGVVAQKN